VEGVEPPFYRPHKESARWGVRDPNISDMEPGHIWKTLLEPGLDTGQVRCTRLNKGKSAGPDMSGSETGYVRRMSLEPNEQARQVQPEDLVIGRRWLTRYVGSRGRTYTTNLFGIRRESQISLADWKD
jgi:hypothetical protein